MRTSVLLKEFSVRQHEDEIRATLESHCRAGDVRLAEPLMVIASGKHALARSFRAAARRDSRDKRRAARAEGRMHEDKWDVVRDITAGCFHRYAATRLLGHYVARPEVFRFLWRTAVAGGFNDGLGGITERAVLALAETLPERAES